MEDLMDYVVVAPLLVALTAFFAAYAIGMITLRAAVNWSAAVLGVSSFASWVRRQENKSVSISGRKWQ
jgi:hypothetical protein